MTLKFGFSSLQLSVVGIKGIYQYIMIYVVLVIELRALDIPDKHTTIWGIVLAPYMLNSLLSGESRI